MAGDLASHLQARMRHIEGILDGSVQTGRKRKDHEVDAWRKKIAELSRPVTANSARRKTAASPSRGSASGRSGRARASASHRDRGGGGAAASSSSRRRKQRTRGTRVPPEPPLTDDTTLGRAFPKRAGGGKSGSGAKICTGCFDVIVRGRCACDDHKPKLRRAGSPMRRGGGGSRAPAQLCTACFDIPCACKKALR